MAEKRNMELTDWLQEHMVVKVRAGADAYPILENEWKEDLGGPFDLRIVMDKLLEPQSVVFIAASGSMAQFDLWRH